MPGEQHPTRSMKMRVSGIVTRFSFRTWRPERRCWLALAGEICIRPAASTLFSVSSSRIYLVDFERGILAYPYDDRGMILAAMDGAALAETKDAFHRWLIKPGRSATDGGAEAT